MENGKLGVGLHKVCLKYICKWEKGVYNKRHNEIHKCIYTFVYSILFPLR